MKKYALPIGLVLLLLVIAIVSAWLLRGQPLRITPKAAVPSASLIFSPSNQTLTTGSTVVAHLFLTNPSQISVTGVDVVLNFDSTTLSPTNVTLTTTAGFTLKTLAPLNSSTGAFDLNKALTAPGVLEFGTVAYDWPTQAVTTPYPGASVELATITFNTLRAVTTTSVSIIKASGASTTDSNVVDNSNPPSDVLATVNTLVIAYVTPTGVVPTPTVTSIPTNTPIPPTPTRTPTPVPTVTPTPLPPTPTRTPTPLPTVTNTPIPPTPTRTPTPVPTLTSTPVPPTPTRTPTPVPSLTPTSVPPTATQAPSQTPTPAPTPVPPLQIIINWFSSNPTYDLNGDGKVNSLDFAQSAL